MYQWGFPGGVVGKRIHLLVQEMQKTQVWLLGHEDPLEEGMATHSSVLTWRMPQTEEPVSIHSMGLQRIGHNQTSEHTHSNCISESGLIPVTHRPKKYT